MGNLAGRYERLNGAPRHYRRAVFPVNRQTVSSRRNAAPEREQPVNFEGSVNQRFREFYPEISGCGRNLVVPFRAPKSRSRNRERPSTRRIFANRCNNWPKTQNARRPGFGVGRQLVGRSDSVESRKAPRARLELATRRLTAACSTN